jgi:excisionase family DNA binding protein
MGRTESLKKISGNLLTTREAAQVLGLSEKDVIELSQEDKIPHYRVAGEFLRFKREDIVKVKSEIQGRFNLRTPTVSVKEKIRETLYFNDFYIISTAIIVVLVWLILKG